MVINYQFRIDSTKTYIDKLRANLSIGWNSIYKMYNNNELNYIDKVTMIHPDFIKSIHLPNYITHGMLIAEIQGERLFRKESGKCQSELIWGYECPLPPTLCSGDHLFPYSLGGPSIAGNKLLLCRYHNMIKGTDIHLFPWEDHLNRLRWVDSQIDALARRISLYSRM
jgi:hypothetical protein